MNDSSVQKLAGHHHRLRLTLWAGLCLGMTAAAVRSADTVRVGVYPGVGDTGIVEALSAAAGVTATIVDSYAPATLSGLDVLVIPHGRDLAVKDSVRPWRRLLRAYVEHGGGLLLTHNAVGYRGLFAEAELFPEIATAIPRGTDGADGRKDAWTFNSNPASTHALARSLPETIRHGYCDHIAMRPGPLGTAVFLDNDGDATVVAGTFGTGRVVAVGALVGARAKVQQLRHFDEEIAAPEGSERALLVETVRWAASGDGSERGAMRERLDALALQPAGKPLLVFASAFAGWRLDPTEWIVPPDPAEDQKTWRGHGLGLSEYGTVGEVFLADQSLAARPFRKGEISGAFVLTFDAMKTPMFGGVLEVALTNPEGWGYGVKLVYASESDPVDATVATRSNNYKCRIGTARNSVFRTEKGTQTVLAAAAGKDARLRMPASGGVESYSGVPVCLQRTEDGWLTLRIDDQVVAAARDTEYETFTALKLTLTTPNGRLAVDNLRLVGFYTDVEAKTYAPPPVILPQPKELELTDAKLRLDNGAQLVVPDKSRVADYCLREWVADVAARFRVTLSLVERGNEDPGLPVIAVRELAEPDPRLGAEGYVLEVTRAGATVQGATARGTFYGLMSLRQLLAREGGSVFLRGGRVRDWPDLDRRGVQLTLKRNTGMRDHVAVLKDQIRMLARLKGNVLIAGSNRFSFPSCPQVGGYDCVWKLAEFDDVVRFARAHHVDVWPQVPGLSHSGWTVARYVEKQAPEFWDWIREHRILGDPDNQDWHRDAFNPGSPEAVELILKLGDDVIAATDAKTVFIGMDEILPPISEMVPDRDPAVVLAEYINTHHAHLAAKGVRLGMWADHLLEAGKFEASSASSGSAHYKDLTHAALERIPKDIILGDWYYSVKPGRPSYAYLKAKGFDAFGMPGSVYGNLYESVFYSCREARQAGIRGIVSFGWETGLHFNPQTSYVLPMVYSWTVPDNMEPDWSIGEVWQDFYQAPSATEYGTVVPLDMGDACNESRNDELAGDGVGWFDYGRNADLSVLPAGQLAYRKLRFRILDEDGNDHRSVVVAVTPAAGATAPARAAAIPVHGSARALLFLHTADNGPHSRRVGCYAVRYADGTTAEVPIVYGQNIGPWLPEKKHTSGFYGLFYKHGYLSESRVAWSGGTRGGERAVLQAYEWPNPYPDKEIDSVTLVADPVRTAAVTRTRIALAALSAVR